MKKVVFNKSPKLDPKEVRVAELHSILNILNVLVGELSLIEMLLDSDQAIIFERLADEITSIAHDMQANDDLCQTLSRVRASEVMTLDAVRGLLQEVDDSETLAEIRESLSNIESVYRIVHKRLNEIESRAQDPDLWIMMSVKEFERQFREVFYAIEKNSKGRYRIFFNLVRKSTSDYYIDLKIDSALQPDALWMPTQLVDVIRDLTANARKYTKPGGQVALAIYQNQESIQVLVEDSGCGIPEDEIERVVEFGYRASNVSDRPTMGGGFGLTKAVWLVHQWGGTFSIETEVGKGTVVRLTVPNKAIDVGKPDAPNFSI